MIDLDVVAYAMLGLSLSVSAVQIGRWILSANPRAIINVGRWSLAALVVLTPLVLLWLVMSGRSTLAMMFAAFILPAFVQGGLRWRALLGPLNRPRGNVSGWALDLGPGIAPHRSVMREPMDPDLVRQSVAVLSAYLEQTARKADRMLTNMHAGSGAKNGTGNGTGRRKLSIEEALDVLGLEPAASPRQINEAHRRLEQRLDPELGGSPYLALKINEARDVLLGE